jgi:methionyl-tRNA synthetase
LDADQRIDPKSRFSGTTPVVRTTEHFFLDLPKLNQQLIDWVRPMSHWRSNVYKFTMNFLEGGLQARAITRDLEWGVPIPLEGYDDKRIYVWFEAVIGYLSASIEWAERSGDPSAWERWWKQPSRSYYFIGKDNIFFHSIIWPGELMAYGDLNLPFDVPANEFMNYEGQKFSKSRGIGIWVPELLEKFDPDPIRYAITTNLPETSDSDFSVAELIRRNNDELVATWGNLVHRTLTFIQRYFDGVVPDFDPLDQLVVERVDRAFADTTAQLEAVHIKDTIRDVMGLAHFGNRFFDERAPWRQVKEDRQACADTLGSLLYLINGLKVLFYPFLPHTSRQLHTLLGFDDELDAHGWGAEQVPAGQKLPKPTPLFVKLEA